MAVTVYEENDLDKDFANFWNDVSCYAVVRFPYDERCEFVKKANSCVYGTNFVPYMRLLACNFKCKNRFEEHAFVSFFMILSFMLLLCTGHVAAVYYSPALKVISRILHMNDHLAGVTIMALCNTIPDLLYQLVIVNDREWIFASDVGRSLFVVMFVGGLVCYMTSFKMHPFNTVRDLLFLLFGTLLLEYSLIANVEILSMITVYVIYLVVNGLDLILIKYTLAVLRRELQQLTETTNSLENAERIKYLTDQIYKLSKEERVQILKRRTTNARHNNFTYLTQSPNTHEKVEIQLFRTTRYSRMNTGLFKEFFFAMKPINVEDWRDANTVVRAFYLVRAPIVVMCAIYIPLVNYEEQKNGWCKLLNCIQIFLNPAITIILGKSLMFRRKDEFWYASVPRNSKYGLYSIIVTVPLAIFVFCHSDTRAPPKYHALFTILNMSGSVFIIFQCNYELRVIFEMVGFLYDVTDEFMNSTVIAVVSSLDDLTTIVTMALHGYEKMAYAAAIGGPLFYVLLHVGSLIAVKKAVNQNVSLNSIMGSYGGLLYVIFTLGIMMTLLWTTLLNFHTRRSVGVFSMSIFGVYMIFAVLINKGLISPYKHEELVYDASKH